MQPGLRSCWSARPCGLQSTCKFAAVIAVLTQHCVIVSHVL